MQVSYLSAFQFKNGKILKYSLPEVLQQLFREAYPTVAG
jgi:hypothetical protein